MDTSFEKTLFVAIYLVGEYLKQIEKSHIGSLNHWVCGLMYATTQNFYNMQYFTMRLGGYMNAPTKPDLLALRHDMEYIMHYSHKPIMYSR